MCVPCGNVGFSSPTIPHVFPPAVIGADGRADIFLANHLEKNCAARLQHRSLLFSDLDDRSSFFISA